MTREYWVQATCTNCGNTFRTMQKDIDDVIRCPFCHIHPVGFAVTGTTKEKFDPESLKRKFIDRLLDWNLNPDIRTKDDQVVQIDIRDKDEVLVCSLDFNGDKEDQVLLKTICWVNADNLKRLTELYQEIVKLYKEIENED